MPTTLLATSQSMPMPTPQSEEQIAERVAAALLPWGPWAADLAYAEGWYLADCGPVGSSAYGPWQIQKADGHRTIQLADDGDAWNIVYHGTGAHHTAAREFLREHNPKELDRIEHWAKTGEPLRNEDDV